MEASTPENKYEALTNEEIHRLINDCSSTEGLDETEVNKIMQVLNARMKKLEDKLIAKAFDPEESQ